MKPTPEQIESLANHVVASMSFEELQQFVFDDVYAIMLEDNDVFHSNLAHHKLTIEELDTL